MDQRAQSSEFSTREKAVNKVKGKSKKLSIKHVDTPQEDKFVSTTSILEHVTDAYLAYGTFVNLGRAFVDIRDGVKPVNRRILYSMHMLKTWGFVKCARVIGHTMGVYHPHGDASIADALVKLTFARYPSVIGQGNFGSAVDTRDGAAAPRYIECKLAPLAKFHFECEKVGEYQPNYDQKETEPVVLPSRFPILLANGTTGIGWAISANLPPHNLGNVLDVLEYVIDNPNADDSDLVGLIGYPDYPNGGILTSTDNELANVYINGSGTLSYRCKYHYEEGDKYGHLVVTEVAPDFEYAKFMDQCVKWIEDGVIVQADDMRDRNHPARIVIAFTSLSQLETKVIPHLHTKVAYHFTVTKKDKVEENWSLLRIARTWLSYRRHIETKELSRQLGELDEKLQRELAKQIAAENLKELFAILSTEKTEDRAIEQMIRKLKLTEFQSKYLLGIPIRSIAKFQLHDVKGAIKNLKEQIAQTQKWLRNIDKWLHHQLGRLRDFVDDRRTVRGPMVVEAPTLDSNARWVASDGGMNLKGWKNPPLAVQWDFTHAHLACSSDKVVVVTEDATVQFLSSALNSRETKSRIVGVAPSYLSHLLLVDEATNVLVIDMEQKKDKILGMKTNKKLVAAYGVDRTSRVIFVPANGDDYILKLVKDLPVKRAGSAPYKLAGKAKGTVVVLGPNVDYYYRESASKVPEHDIVSAVTHDSAIPVGDRNFLVQASSKAKVLSRKELLLTDLSQVVRCIPVF